jgi:predicted phage tail protein
MFCNPDATISITPVLTGAGGGVGKTIAGVALIAGALFLGPSAAIGGAGFLGATFGAGVIGGVAATAIGSVGAALVLGGVAQMITPKPPTLGLGGPSPLNDPRALQSYNFNGIQNTSTQGTPINVVYGKTIVGSVTLSAGITNTSKK